MFYGEYQHSLDPKCRLIVPAKYREGLGDIFMVTKGLDNCLFLYPVDEWKKFEEKLRNLSVGSADARAVSRFLFSGACECEMDKQGRILIPQNLREYAQIDKDVMVTGAGVRVEVWARDKWETYLQRTEATCEELAEKLGI